MAWVRERAARAATSLAPIVGPRGLSRLDSYLGALEVDLTAELFARLPEVSEVPLGVPHEAVVASLAGAQGGDAGRVIAPAVPMA
ncbi:hypothetical protein ACFQVC_08645 [Streptomyces monticola]|uniref:Uncharacterized protein n=1 Tax=Streptomyces monticola TaxID=2666263 RepID=A0ABW2JFV6_9ACTN